MFSVLKLRCQCSSEIHLAVMVETDSTLKYVSETVLRREIVNAETESGFIIDQHCLV